MLAATTFAVGSYLRMILYASWVSVAICLGVPCQNVVRLASFQIWYDSIELPYRFTTAVTQFFQSLMLFGFDAAPLLG